MSYCTVDAATSYIATHYVSTDEARVRWTALSADDKQALLTKAHDVIDALPITGVKTDTAQADAFPRYPETTVPTVVQNAEVELALALSDSSLNDDASNYKRMVDYGISSYSIGNFSETLLQYNKNSIQMKYGLVSDSAERLLQPWLSGGFRIG